MSRTNPFAPPEPRAPRPRRPRRAPDHPPVVRRLRRMGLSLPQPLQAEMYRRWAAMTDDERLESIDAEAAMTDDELREGWGELMDEIAATGVPIRRAVREVRPDG